MTTEFWSDSQITISIDKKQKDNSGITDVYVQGSGDILCSNVELPNNLNNTTANDKTNYSPGNTDTTNVNFYASVNDPNKSYAKGNIGITVKWIGVDGTENSSDDTYSDEHIVQDIIIKNAVNKINLLSENDLWISDINNSLNTIELTTVVLKDSEFNTGTTNNYIYYTSSEGDDYLVYSKPFPTKMDVTSDIDNFNITKYSATEDSITLLFDKTDIILTTGYIDYVAYGSYLANSVSGSAKNNVCKFYGKLKDPINSIVIDDSGEVYSFDADTTYNLLFYVNSKWGGRPYSYDLDLSGNGMDYAVLSTKPEDNAGIGYISITPTITGDFSITISSTAESSETIVSKTINFKVRGLAPTYTAPTAKTELEYTGYAQVLINEGETEDGTFKYSFDNNTWFETIPKGTNAGQYIVYWKLVGDDSHKDVICSEPFTINIDKRILLLKPNGGTHVYDDTDFIITDFTDYDRLVEGHICTIKTKTSLRTVGQCYNEIDINEVTITDSDGNDVKDNYNIILENKASYLKVTARPITITAASDSKTYDGTELTKTEGCIVSTEEGDGLVDGHSITSRNEGSAINVTDDGINTIKEFTIIRDSDGTDVTSNYEVKKETGKLVIEPREITVTGGSSTGNTYDGIAKIVNTAKLTKGDLVEGQEISVQNSLTETNVKDLENNVYNYIYKPEIKIIIKADNTDVTDNYDIKIETGILEILPRDITIKPVDKSKVYDGTALTLNLCECSDNSLLSGHKVVVTTTGSAKNVSDVILCVITECKILIADTDEDVSGNYKINLKTGTLTITKRPITVTADSASKDYDGTALVCSTATANENGLANNLRLYTYETIGSQTNAGSSDNIVKEDTVVIYDSLNNNVTENYEIELKTGTLTVNPAASDFALTFTGVDLVYDTYPHYATVLSTMKGTLYWSKSKDVTIETGTSISINVNITTNITSITQDADDSNPDFIIYAIFVPDDTNYGQSEVHQIYMNIDGGPLTLPTADNINVEYADTYYSCVFKNGCGGSITKYRYSTDNSTWTETTINPQFKTVCSYYIQAYYQGDENHTYGSDWTESVKLVIYQKEVLILGSNLTIDYDGEFHTVNTITFIDGYSLIKDHTYTVVNNLMLRNATEGTQWTPEIKIYNSEEEVTGNYNVISFPGTMVIKKLDITITAGTSLDDHTYDGYPYTYQVATVTGNLLSNQHLHSCLYTGSLTLYSETPVDNIPYNAVIYRLASVYHSASETIISGETDVTENYNITYVSGKISIKKRPITITANSDSKTYDGTPLTCSTYTISSKEGDGLAPTDSIKYIFIDGTITNCYDGPKGDGITLNFLKSVTIYNDTYNDYSTGSYDTSLYNGTLEITKAIPTLTSTGLGTFLYDGTEHTIKIAASLDGKVYYTTDGTSPTTSSTYMSVTAGEYNEYASIKNAGSITVKAFLAPAYPNSLNYGYSNIIESSINIGILPGVVTLETTEKLVLTYPTTQKTVNITAHSGTLSVLSSDASICSCSLGKRTDYSSSTEYYIILNWVKAGTAIITVSSAATDNYTSATTTIDVEIKKGDLSCTIVLPTNNKFTYNENTTITLTGNTENAAVSWSSSDSDYITVSGNTSTAIAKCVLCDSDKSITFTAIVSSTDHYNGTTVTSGICYTEKATDKPTFDSDKQTLYSTWSTTNLTLSFNPATAKTSITYSLPNAVNSSGTKLSAFGISGTNIIINYETYSSQLPPGTYTLTVRAESSGNTNYNKASTDTTITLIISKASDTGIAVTMSDIYWHYLDGQLNVTSASNDYTTTWYHQTNATTDTYELLGTGTTYMPTKLSDVGKYKVIVTANSNTYFTGGQTAETTFNVVIPGWILGKTCIGYSILGGPLV